MIFPVAFCEWKRKTWLKQKQSFAEIEKTKIKVSFYGQIKHFENNIPYQIANIFLFSAHLIVYCHWEGGKTQFLDK